MGDIVEGRAINTVPMGSGEQEVRYQNDKFACYLDTNGSVWWGKKQQKNPRMTDAAKEINAGIHSLWNQVTIGLPAQSA